MADKTTSSRGVVDSIARLRELRYNTRGPGAIEKRRRPPAVPSVKRLQAAVDKIPATKPKKAKKRRARR